MRYCLVRNKENFMVLAWKQSSPKQPNNVLLDFIINEIETINVYTYLMKKFAQAFLIAEV